MEYIKFEIDNLTNDHVFCQYREITEEGKSEIKNRVFPLELLVIPAIMVSAEHSYLLMKMHLQ